MKNQDGMSIYRVDIAYAMFIQQYMPIPSLAQTIHWLLNASKYVNANLISCPLHLWQSVLYIGF